jgi:hypothetical protein
MLRFPLEEMSANNSLVRAKGAFCLEKPGEIYLVYLPAGTRNAGINLPSEKRFSVKWYNPGSGGELADGTVSVLQGNGVRSVGDPPYNTEKDWVVVITQAPSLAGI